VLDCFFPQLEAPIICQAFCFAQPCHCSYDRASQGTAPEQLVIPRVTEMPGADHPHLPSALHILSLQAGRRGKSRARTQSVLQRVHMCQVILKVSKKDLSKAESYRSKVSEKKLHAPLV